MNLDIVLQRLTGLANSTLALLPGLALGLVVFGLFLLLGRLISARLTRAVQHRQARVTCGGAEVYVWPGGGITFMVDVTRLPEGAFGSVPTPALVAPLEFTMAREDYLALGGHAPSIRSLGDILATGGEYTAQAPRRVPGAA